MAHAVLNFTSQQNLKSFTGNLYGALKRNKNTKTGVGNAIAELAGVKTYEALLATLPATDSQDSPPATKNAVPVYYSSDVPEVITARDGDWEDSEAGEKFRGQFGDLIRKPADPRNALVDDYDFIAIRDEDSQIGLLIEVETIFVEEGGTDWLPEHLIKLDSEAFALITAKFQNEISPFCQLFPDAEFYLTYGELAFDGRLTLCAYIPMPSKNLHENVFKSLQFDAAYVKKMLIRQMERIQEAYSAEINSNKKTLLPIRPSQKLETFQSLFDTHGDKQIGFFDENVLWMLVNFLCNYKSSTGNSSADLKVYSERGYSPSVQTYYDALKAKPELMVPQIPVVINNVVVGYVYTKEQKEFIEPRIHGAVNSASPSAAQRFSEMLQNNS